MKFRKLNANEIECRVQSVKAKGFIVLLYKDARCDMNILDETVPNKAWKRDHKEINNHIYCGVGIKIGQDWITKWDAGAESNIEKAKGEASDSFKRACFNWGIGRELYTSPFMWLTPLPFEQDDFNKKKVYTKFEVTKIEYYKEKIKYVEIMDNKGNVRFTWGNPNIESPQDTIKRAELELKQAYAVLGKDTLPSKLALECEDIKMRREATLDTLKSFNIKNWEDLDLSVVTEETFIREFNIQVEKQIKIKKEGI